MSRKIAICIGAMIGLVLGSFMPASGARAEPTTATWYGAAHEGSPTASGEPFRARGYTAAHPSLPFGSRLSVCKEACTTVRVNDRPDDKTELDLSEAAAETVGLKDEGRASVTVEQTSSKPVVELPRTGGIGR